MTGTTQTNRAGQFPDMVPAKYPTWSAWGQAQTDRLKSWGFNAAGQYSYAYYANAPATVALPVEGVQQVSGHAKRDDVSGSVEYYHCKSVNHDYQGMTCAPSYIPPGGGQLDAFDASCASGAGVSGAYMADLSPSGNSYIHAAGAPSNVMFYATEEGDDLYGINNIGHEDFGYVVAARNPMMGSSPSGYVYPNKTLDAKIALRDFLASRYGCPGTPMPDGDDLYPAAAHCGASSSSAALAALNSAWGTGYTTWSTSDSNGEPGIRDGAYGSYGSGTGFLDENGSNLLAAGVSCGNIKVNTNWSKNPRITTDLHDYVAYFSTTYAQKLSAAWAQSVIGTHAPVFMPLYRAPDYVYKAVAPYFDGFWINPTDLADLQRIIAASSVPSGKSMPIIVGDYSSANPDSPFSSFVRSGSLTQAQRGTRMVSFWADALRQRDANGRYVVVGLEHWGYYDQANENANLGLVTSDADNPYDGSATNILSSPATLWRSGTYTAPSIVHDGANYQALSGGMTTSCLSGAAAPRWEAVMGAATADGSCVWRNEGPYPLKPEPSIAGSATLPGKAYGDIITPIATFLNGGICDSSELIVPDTTAPSVPSGVTATAVSTSDIAVAWTASTDPDSPVAGYFVYRDGKKVATVGTNSYSDSGLAPNATYAYTVMAYDAAGNISAESPVASGTTLPLGPAATPLVTLRASNLNWRRVADSTSETINLPAVADGDIVIVQLVMDSSAVNTSANVPPGYAPISEKVSGSNHAPFEGIYWHKWSAGDPTSVVFSWINPAAPVWSVSTWAGADPANLIDAFGFGTTATRDIYHVAPSINLQDSRSVVLRFAGVEHYYNNSFTFYPSGFTTLQTKQADGILPSLYLGVMESTVNPTGSSTLVSSVATYSADHIVALRPAGSTTTPPPPPPTGFYVGERVTAMVNVNVRRQACTGKLVGVEPQGGSGTITSGPKNDCGSTWWMVTWDDGLKGWSAQNDLGAQ